MFAIFKDFFLKNTGIRQTIAKNAFWLAVAEVVARVLALFLTIYIARVLGVQEYGKFTFALAFASLVAIASDLGIIDIAVRDFSKDRKNEERFDAILGVSMVLALAGVLVSLVGGFFVTPESDVRAMIVALTAYVVGNNVFGIFFAFIRARLRMEYEALIKIAQGLAVLVAALAAGWYFASAQAVSYGYFLGSAMILAALAAYFMWRVRPIALRFRLSDLHILHVSWPLAFGLIPGWIYLSMDAVLLGYFGLVTENGWYGAASRIAIAAMIIANLAGRSFYPVLANLFFTDRQKLKKIWTNLFELMSLLAAPLLPLAAVLARGVIALLYGDGFEPASQVLVLLSAVVAMAFMTYPFTVLLVVSNRQRKHFALVAGGALVNLGLDVALVPQYGLVGVAASTIIAGAVILISTVVLFGQLRLSVFSWRAAKTLGVAAYSALLMHMVMEYSVAHGVLLPVVFLLGCATYGVAFGLLYAVVHKYPMVNFLNRP